MTRKLPVTPNDQTTSIGVTGSFVVMESYWKLSGHWSYWKLSGHGELLEVVWSIGVTGSFLVMDSYWK
jgi:hypothetical protein